jgi:hypothetical protein
MKDKQLSFLKIKDGHLVQLEHYTKQPTRWTIFMEAVTVVVILGVSWFLWISLPK